LEKSKRKKTEDGKADLGITPGFFLRTSRSPFPDVIKCPVDWTKKLIFK